MGKIARRKKEVTVDGATETISPLTELQMEEYAAMSDAYGQKWKEKTDDKLSKEQLAELSKMTRYVICCGLTGAGKEITEDELKAELDDVFAARLFREILEFTGVKVPTPEEVDGQAKAAREERTKRMLGALGVDPNTENLKPLMPQGEESGSST